MLLGEDLWPPQRQRRLQRVSKLTGKKTKKSSASCKFSSCIISVSIKLKDVPALFVFIF